MNITKADTSLEPSSTKTSPIGLSSGSMSSPLSGSSDSNNSSSSNQQGFDVIIYNAATVNQQVMNGAE